MKNFNIMKNQQRICGRIIPTNAIYGSLTLKYTRKVPIEKYRVTDKDGHLVFNADGTEKTAWKTRRENCAEKIIYSIETTKMYRDDKGISHFYVQLGRKNKNGDIIWREHVLGDCALTRELEKFLTVKIVENGLWSQWDTYKIEDVRMSERRTIHNSAPKRREVQKDYLFKGQYGYFVNPNIINEEVRPRMPIVKTNMDKLHPVDSRPIYSSKTKSKPTEQYVKYTHTIIVVDENGKTSKHIKKIKDTVCNNPANDGYIRHADGTVTTRDGKTIKTGI